MSFDSDFGDAGDIAILRLVRFAEEKWKKFANKIF